MRPAGRIVRCTVSVVTAGTLAVTLLSAPMTDRALAVDATWNGTTDGLWSTGSNWSATPVPGSGNTATFNNAGGGNVNVTTGAIGLGNLLFDTSSAAAYTLAGGTITLDPAGTVVVNGSVVNNQVVNSAVVLGGNNVVTNNSGATLTLGGTLSGATGLTKTGTGVVRLTGSLTYAADLVGGDTIVNGGTLVLARASAFPGAGSAGQFSSAHKVVVNSGGTLQLNANWAAGDGLANQVVVNEGGTLQFLNSDNYLGNITLTGGAITTSGGDRPWRTGNWGNGLITVNASALSSTIAGSLNFVGTAAATKTTFNVADGAAADDLAVSANIFDHPGFEGRMLLVKDGPGTMVMTGNVNSTGGVRVDGGTLRLAKTGIPTPSAGGELGAGQTVTVNAGATLDLATIWVIGNGLANQVVVNGGTLKFSYDNYLSRITLNGGTIVAAGGVYPWRTGNFGDALITVSANANSSFIQSSLAMVKTASATTTTFDVADGAAADDLVMSGAIFDHPGGYEGMTLIKTGAGKMVLSGANTYQGATTINGGTLQLAGGNNRLPTTTALVLGNVAGAVLDLNNLNQTVASLAGGGTTGGNIALGSGTLTVGNAASTTYGGVISGAGALVKTGAGTLGLTGVSTFTGNVTVAQGTLEVSGIQNKGVASSVGAGTTITLGASGSNGTLKYNGGGQNNDRDFVLAAGGSGTIDLLSTAYLDINGVISGGGDLHKTGGATGAWNSGTRLSLNNVNVYTGNTYIDDGVLQVSGAGTIPDTSNVTIAATGRFRLNKAEGINGLLGSGTVQTFSGFPQTLTVGVAGGSGDFSGVIEGGIILVKAGAGTQVLSGVNTYGGSTTVNGGVLRLAGGDNRLPTTTALVLGNAAGAVLDLNNLNQTVASLAGGGTTGGAVALGSGTLTVDGSTNTTYSGALSGSGSLVKQGSGTLTLNSAVSNTMTGGVTINAGKLTLGASRGFNEGYFQNQATVFTINAGGALDLAGSWVTSSIATYNVNGGTINTTSGGDANYVNHLSMTGGTITGTSGIRTGYFFNTTWTVNGSASGSSISAPVGLVKGTGTVLTIDVADGAAPTDLEISGRINDVSGYPGLKLLKSGAGTMLLSAANTYSGPTEVTAGRLLVNGSLAGGAVTVSGGLLGGTGTIGGAVTVLPGATLSAGNSPGTLNLAGGLTENGTLLVDVWGPDQGVATGYDFVHVTGLATLNGPVQALLGNGFVPDSLDTFDVLTASAGIDLGPGFLIDPSSSGLGPAQYWSYRVLGPQGGPQTLELFVAVPEPTSLALAVLAALGLLAYAVRRRPRGS